MLRELLRNIVAAAGWLIVSAVVVVLLAYVVSAIW
jgi:hypothetical protein